MIGTKPGPYGTRRTAAWLQVLIAASAGAVVLLSVAGLVAVSGLDTHSDQTVDALMLARSFVTELALLPLGVVKVLQLALQPSITGLVQLGVIVGMAIVSLRAVRGGLLYVGEGAYGAALASLALPFILLILLTAII